MANRTSLATVLLDSRVNPAGIGMAARLLVVSPKCRTLL
jgi:hypothetical protein